jgi:hypothetical protein
MTRINGTENLLIAYDFKQIMIHMNIWDRLESSGSMLGFSQKPFTSLFDEEKFRQSKTFGEIWVIDFPFDDLPR